MTYKKTILARLLSAGLFAMSVSGCTNPLDGATLEIDDVCAISTAAFARNDFDYLLSYLERQLGVTRRKMRITQEGIFIPMKERFAEEQGYFVVKSGVDVSSNGTDPSFDLIRECVYRYRIKG